MTDNKKFWKTVKLFLLIKVQSNIMITVEEFSILYKAVLDPDPDL